VSLRAARQALLEQRDLHGDAFCRAYAAAADRWLTDLLLSAAGGDITGIALVAVGGYGRGELCPGSDLDVVLVHNGSREVSKIADAVWYPVWDEGVSLDHSVRRPKEVLAVAREDLRAQLGLVDGRLVAGDPRVAEPLLRDALELWKSSAPRWFPILADQVRERHRTQGEVAFLLEPDLKEAHGGLRDVHVLAAARLALPAVAELVDPEKLTESAGVLTTVRVEVHRTTGRPDDRLLLQDQDQVASALGLPDADALMAQVAAAGRAISWLENDVWRRRSLWTRKRVSRLSRSRYIQDEGIRVVEPGIALSGPLNEPEDNQVLVAPNAELLGDPALALRVAAVAAERSIPIARGTLDSLEAATRVPGVPWSVDVRDALVRVLAAGPPAIPALEALDQRGLLVRILPEWAAVRNRPQRNAYHTFTVDRHLLEAAARAAALAHRVARPDLLLVGALLHDIGKGYPGDHTAVGITLVHDIATRMGFPPADVGVLTDMVRYHLLLPDVATRRDLDDPATVESVAAALVDRSTLELLAALTEADSLATGPAAWGAWKAGLVADLVRRTAAHMAGDEPVAPPVTLVTDEHRALIDRVRKTGRPALSADEPRVTVVAGDRPGLLAAVAGVLALSGLDVRSANVTSEDGFAVEIFGVEPAHGRWPDWGVVAKDLDDVLSERMRLEERLEAQARSYRVARQRSARPIKTQVTIDNSASATATVLEVHAEDRVGLLHRVTRALFDCRLDVAAARVSTLGYEVIDAFYVHDANGGKLVDPESIRTVKRAIRAALDDAN
jgi:[protein-PII] uridylyltransferase